MHTHVALRTADIPDSVATLNPNYTDGRFSNDGAYRLIDGYKVDENETHILDEHGAKVLVQIPGMLHYWLRGEPAANRDTIIQQILGNAIEYTRSEIRALFKDTQSIWYQARPEV